MQFKLNIGRISPQKGLCSPGTAAQGSVKSPHPQRDGTATWMWHNSWVSKVFSNFIDSKKPVKGVELNKVHSSSTGYPHNISSQPKKLQITHRNCDKQRQNPRKLIDRGKTFQNFILLYATKFALYKSQSRNTAVKHLRIRLLLRLGKRYRSNLLS